MEHFPLVSIIIPVYNVSNYLKRCLDSVIAQSYDKLEIILVNDGSTDNSRGICDAYAAKDKRILVINQKNGGLVRARKAGLAVSKGRFIGFVDGDDWIEINMYASLIKLIMQYDVEFVWSGVILEDGKSSFVQKGFTTGLCLDPRKELTIWQKIVEERGPLRVLMCKLFKRELICKAYQDVPEDCDLGEDYIATVSCLLRCKKMYAISEAFYHYDISRPGSLTKGKDMKFTLSISRAYDCVYRLLSKYNVEENIISRLQNAYVLDMLLSFNRWILGTSIPVYRASCIDELLGKKIILYGAGKVGKDYYIQLTAIPSITVVSWVDKYLFKTRYNDRKIDMVEHILEVKYDAILIAVENCQLAEEIRTNLKKMGIQNKKIIWKPVQKYVEYT